MTELPLDSRSPVDYDDDMTTTTKPARVCRHCAMTIEFDEQAWVDETGGDVCCAEDNENEPHQPERRNPFHRGEGRCTEPDHAGLSCQA